MSNIGNHRLFQAVQVLATGLGDVRSRMAVAMAIVDRMQSSELSDRPDLRSRLDALLKRTSKHPANLTLGKVTRNTFKVTAGASQNKTYSKLARELFDIWIETTTC